MAQALRLVSTDRGYDPRGSTLVAYGGAGPLHACELARALQMKQVVVPLYPGAFSAFGALLADTRFDYTQTRWMRMSRLDVEAAREVFARARAARRGRLPRRGLQRGAAARALHRHALRRPELGAQRAHAGRRADAPTTSPRAAELFEAEHERFYGYSIPGEELEMLTFNVAAVGTRHADRAAAARARRPRPSPSRAAR